MSNVALDGVGKTWTLPDPLVHNDSLQIRVKVAAECGFSSGMSVNFILNATSACGDALPGKTVTTPRFYTRQDVSQRNTFDITSLLSHNKVTNNTGDTVTWQLTAMVHGAQTTDATTDTMQVLIPFGLSVVPDSYVAVQNAPGRDSLVFSMDQLGLKCKIPVRTGLTEGDVIIAKLKFTTRKATCSTYNLSSEIVYSDRITCGNTECSFFSTRGGVYPTLTVERYRFSLGNSIYGQTVDDLWYGNIEIKAETEFFAGDSIFIDFYTDRNNNSVPDAADGDSIRSFTHITGNVPAQGLFTVNFAGVPVTPQKQLLANVRGKVICNTATIPIATLTGTDTVCEADTAYYYTASGMKTYKWLVIKPVDAVSGATPVRIPLENSTTDNYINENVARVVWKKKGDYTVWTQYTLPGTNPPHEIARTYFPRPY